jgi:hypothetical protein
MASTLEKIKTLLSKSKETKMYAEMILDDGRVLATEDEQFMIGSVVMVVGDDGATEKLPAGSYTMSDGAKITIDENSKIVDLGEEKEAEGVEKPEEMQEEDEEKEEETKAEEEEIDEEKLAKAIDEATPDSVDKKKAKDMAKRVKEYAEEEEKEEEKVEASKEEEKDKEEVVEMSKDLITSLVEEVEHLKSKVVELEKVPGSKGFTHNPENNTKSEKPNLANMTAQERAAFYINNK